MENSNSENIDLSPAAKALFGFVGTVLSALIFSTWNTVNNSSLDIVRLQGRTTTIEERVGALKDVDQDKIRDLNTRLTNLEARVIVLEKGQK